MKRAGLLALTCCLYACSAADGSALGSAPPAEEETCPLQGGQLSEEAMPRVAERHPRSPIERFARKLWCSLVPRGETREPNQG